MKRKLISIYKRLYAAYGPQRWWPGRTDFEIIVGAILTQNTSWSNVEKAINNLRKADALKPQRLKDIPDRRLARLIRSAGYYNIKARRLKNFLRLLFSKYGGSLSAMSRTSTDTLRRELLSVNGVGPETADSMLLYVFKRPVFVIDAYTKRVFSRHNFFKAGAAYEEAQGFFTKRLPADEKLFNEYHALIVKVAKERCRKRPDCQRCPLVVI